MFPEGIESVHNILNKVIEMDGCKSGPVTYQQKWLATFKTANNMAQLCSPAQNEFKIHMTEIRSAVERIVPLSERNRITSCETPVTTTVLIIDPARTMRERYEELLNKLRDPYFSHQPRLSRFINIKRFLDITQSPTPIVDKEISDHPAYYFGVLRVAEKTKDDIDNKIAILHEILATIKENGTKMIIFSDSIQKLRHIGDILPNAIHYYGEIREKKLSENLSEFKRSKEAHVLLMSTRLAVGLNIEEASTVIFMEPPWTHTVLGQAVGRVTRYLRNN